LEARGEASPDSEGDFLVSMNNGLSFLQRLKMITEIKRRVKHLKCNYKTLILCNIHNKHLKNDSCSFTYKNLPWEQK